MAKILLVEANSSSYDDLFAAVDTARRHAGVSAVSMSWAGTEFSGQGYYDSFLTTPAGHTGVTFVASSGDSGAYDPGNPTVKAVEYPAVSPNVLSVGGTYLTTDVAGNYASESGWGYGTTSGTDGGAGGGISQFVAQPAFQHGVVTQSATARTLPDVSFNADPSSGVAVCDSYDFPTAPWAQVGGTSLAAPLWGGVIALANQGRATIGQQPLDGPTGTLPKLYALPATDFHDVTTGNNGFPAGAGYDLVTGRGSPIVNQLLTDLVGAETPFGGTPLTIAATGTTQLETENFDNGGEGLAYHDTTAANEGGAYRNTAVDIENTTDAGGGYDVGWAHGGEWLRYSVNAAATGNYDLSVRVAAVAQGGAFHIEIDGANVTGTLTVPNTGGWQNYVTLTKTNVPIAAGAHIVRLVMDTDGSSGFTGNFNWIQFNPTASSPPGSTPYGGTPINIAATGKSTIEAENFDNGGEGVAYHDTTAANEGGAYRSTGVDIEATTDAGGGYDVGWAHGGEWLNYTVNATAAGSYDLSVRVACAVQGGSFHVEVDGVNLTGALTVPNTGGWQNYVTLTKTAVPLLAGNHIVRLVMDTNGSSGFVGNFNWIQFNAVSNTPPGSTPYSGTPINIASSGSSTVDAENFDNGGEGVAYHDTTAANEGGAYRNTGVDVEATTDAGGGFDVGWTHAGEWLKYTVNALSTGVYTLALRVADAVQGGTYHVEVDGTNVTGAMTVPNTGAWQAYVTQVKTAVPITAGLHVIRLVMDTEGQYGFVGNFNWLRFTRTG